MVTGAHPFRRTSSVEIMAAILRDPPEIVGGDAQLPQALVVLIRRLLAKSPADRHESTSEVRDALTRLSRYAPEESALREPGGDVRKTSHLPVIGRDRELVELRRALGEALAGRGSLVVIGGEPGIGKTHLTSELLDVTPFSLDFGGSTMVYCQPWICRNCLGSEHI